MSRPSSRRVYYFIYFLFGQLCEQYLRMVALYAVAEKRGHFWFWAPFGARLRPLAPCHPPFCPARRVFRAALYTFGLGARRRPIAARGSYERARGTPARRRADAVVTPRCGSPCAGAWERLPARRAPGSFKSNTKCRSKYIGPSPRGAAATASAVA